MFISGTGGSVMTMYGVYLRNPEKAQVEWFTTTKALPPGGYVLRDRHAASPNVYVAESTAALVLAVGPVIERMETEGQRALGTRGIEEDETPIATRLTSQLMGELNETSSVWQHNPRWVHELLPFPAT